jgi:hypothetical protein
MTVEKLKKIIEYLQRKVLYYLGLQEEARLELLEKAKKLLGKDLSSIAPNSLGCAETISRVIHEDEPLFPIITGTATLLTVLRSKPNWIEISTPEIGSIIISPTGYGKNRLAHGHCGLIGEKGIIYSNNSNTGLFDDHLTLDSWKVIFKDFPTFYFSQRK